MAQTEMSPLIIDDTPEDVRRQIADVEARVAEINVKRAEAARKAREEAEALAAEERRLIDWRRRNLDEIATSKLASAKQAYQDASDACDAAMERLKVEALKLEAPGRALVEAERARRKAHRAAAKLASGYGIPSGLESCPVLDTNGGLHRFAGEVLFRLYCEGRATFDMPEEYNRPDESEAPQPTTADAKTVAVFEHGKWKKQK